MSKYFRFVGIVELLGFVVGLIYCTINMVGAFSSNSPDALLILLIFFAVLVFGPAVGLLFLAVASLLENQPTNQENSNSSQEDYGVEQNKSKNEKQEPFTEQQEKRALIAKNNYDKHLSDDDVENLMKLSLEDLNKLFEKKDN